VRRLALSLSCILLAVGALNSTGIPTASARPALTTHDASVCRHAFNARTRCFAIRYDRVRHGRVRHSSTPLGYGPVDLQAAYSLPSATAGSHDTVAIVDAYDDPQAEHDLGVYRAQFGEPACTTANGCFRKVDQTGGTTYPQADGGWGQEISLDLDMVSAVCPKCRILLVEASSDAMANLGTAEDTAARLGANAISNSYGGADASDSSYGRYYHHSGVAVVASAGDSGYGVSYPASSKWVTAVGGTSLRRSSSARGFTETAWSDTGSGCSEDNATTWQPQEITGCPGRAMSDVAAVADPATGVAVYDSYDYRDTHGWLTFGGTSASSPIIAATFALAGNTSDVTDGSFLWEHQGGLHDITSGANGSCTPDPAQWCTARRGWDGPTGWGTPDGTAAF
jgi:subtilase family serine protease